MVDWLLMHGLLHMVLQRQQKHCRVAGSAYVTAIRQMPVGSSDFTHQWTDNGSVLHTLLTTYSNSQYLHPIHPHTMVTV